MSPTAAAAAPSTTADPIASAARFRERNWATLLEFGAQCARERDAERVLEQTLRTALSDSGADLGYIMLSDEFGGGLTTEIVMSLDTERSFPLARLRGEGIEGQTALRATPTLFHRELAVDMTIPHFEAEALLCVPMLPGPAEGEAAGVVTLVSFTPGHRFTEEDVAMGRTLAALAVLSLGNARRAERLRAGFLRSLQATAAALEVKVPYMQGHSERVADLCEFIGQRLQMPADAIAELRAGALLHEIGKVGIPEAILTKPGQLTDDEMARLRKYPEIGYDICRPLGLGDEVLRLIRNHAERLDGTGYPDGLKFGELTLSLRILCAADAFDAMSSYRPWRKEMNRRARNEELNRFAGTQFDPVIIETLKGLLNAGELDALYRGHWPEEHTPELTLVEAV